MLFRDLEQPDRADQLHERERGILRGCRRVNIPDAVRRRYLQPPQRLQLLSRLHRRPCWKLFDSRFAFPHPLLGGDLAEPDRSGQLHERERGILRGRQRIDGADPVRTWYMEQPDRADQLHERERGILRGCRRVNIPDAVRRRYLQPPQRLQLLSRLHRRPCWKLFDSRFAFPHPLLGGDLAEPDRSGQLHERERGILRGRQRIDGADPVRTWYMEQPDRADQLHERERGVLRGRQRVGDPDPVRRRYIQPNHGL